MVLKGKSHHPSSTTTGASSTTDADPYDDYGIEDDVVTGVTRKARVVLSKRTWLLAVFVIITGLGVAWIVQVFRYIRQFDIPPTQLSTEAFDNTLYAIFAITIVTPIGFVILKFRIANLTFGFVYMFLMVVCLFFSSKGISRAYLSIKQDTESSIKQYAPSFQNEQELHPFWAVQQKEHQCCGTKDIDRVEDWPGLLHTSNMPTSCCTEDHVNNLLDKYTDASSTRQEREKVILSCGLGLGATRTRGFANRTLAAKRVFSGFFLSLTDAERRRVVDKFQIEGEPQKYLVDQMDVADKVIKEMDPLTAFRKVWKVFYVDAIWNAVEFQHSDSDNISAVDDEYRLKRINYAVNDICELDEELEKGVDVDHTLPAQTLGVIDQKSRKTAFDRCKRRLQNRIHQDSFCKGLDFNSNAQVQNCCQHMIPEARHPQVTIGRELMLRLDFLTSYLYELGKQPGEDGAGVDGKLDKKSWVMWPIPTRLDVGEAYPYKLNANLFRVPVGESLKENAKKMYYLSRGISENLLLQNVIHSQVCGLTSHKYELHARIKMARDMNKRWRSRGPVAEWINVDEGLGSFFLFYVHEVVFACVIVAGASIGCVVLIAVTFWQYYSRIKAEEYANLALPKEFEVLHLKRGSGLDEKDMAQVRRNQVGPAPSGRGGWRGRGRGGHGGHGHGGRGGRR